AAADRQDRGPYGADELRPPYPPGPGAPLVDPYVLHPLSRRPVLLSLHRADSDRPLPDVLLRALDPTCLPGHAGPPVRGDLRRTDPQHAPLGGARDGDHGLAAHGARLPDGRL